MKFRKSQTIYSCKRLATRVLGYFNDNPTFDDILKIKDGEFWDIFSPYDPTALAEDLEQFIKEKSIGKAQKLNRATLLNFFAYADSSLSWETFQHKTKQTNYLTFSLSSDGIGSLSELPAHDISVHFDNETSKTFGCLMSIKIFHLPHGVILSQI